MDKTFVLLNQGVLFDFSAKATLAVNLGESHCTYHAFDESRQATTSLAIVDALIWAICKMVHHPVYQKRKVCISTLFHNDQR